MDRTQGELANGAKGAGEWIPVRDAVREPDSSGIGARQIRHARYPYVVFVPADVDQATLEQQLFQLAVEYLGRANDLLKLPASWIPSKPQADASSDGLRTVWLPFHQDLRGSYWTIRYEDPIHRNGIIDRAAVLLGSLAVDAGSKGKRARVPLHGGQGIRVVAQCDAPINGQIPVRFTSVGSTLPRLMDEVERKQLDRVPRSAGTVGGGRHQVRFKILGEFAQQVSALFGLTAQTVPIEFGIRITDAVSGQGGWNIEIVSKTAPPKPRRGGKTVGRARHGCPNRRTSWLPGLSTHRRSKRWRRYRWSRMQPPMSCRAIP